MITSNETNKSGSKSISKAYPKGYTVLGNYHLRDKRISNKARGLLSTMLSLPPNWHYTIRGLACICKDGVDAIALQLKELEQYGYLHRRQIRNAQGQMDHVEYVFYAEPHPNPPERELPVREKPDTEKP